MIDRIAARTVVEAFLPVHGEVPLGLVYDTANAVGIDDQPLRLAIRRMQAAGEVQQHGRGRSGSLSLTPAGRAAVERDRAALHVAAAQDAGALRWDGSWHLFAVGAPETERAARDALRRDLTASGAASLSTGVFLSPHDLRPLLPPSAAPYIVSATVTDLDVRGERDPAAIAELLWPAAAIDARYDVVERALALDDVAAPADVRRLRLADALERALRDDPLIPPELRGGSWRPASLRRRWGQRWDEIGPGAAYAAWAAGDFGVTS